MQLRDYQQLALDKVLISTDNKIVVMPTGTGKTLVLSHIAKYYIKENKRVVVLAPSTEIIDQIYTTLLEIDVLPILVRPSKHRYLMPNYDIILLTVAKLMNTSFYNVLKTPDILLIDEAHRIGSSFSIYRQIIDQWQKAGVRIIGFTGTLERMDTNTIIGNDIFDSSSIIYPISPAKAIQRGILATPVFKRMDWSDYADPLDSTETALKKAIELIINTEHKHILIFCTNLKYVNLYLSYFKELAPPESYASVDGRTADTLRNNVFKNFREGRIRFLLSVGVVTTGIDLPMVDCLVFLRFANSISLYKQILGRGLRLYPNKTQCYIYDFVGITSKITDIDSICTATYVDRTRDQVKFTGAFKRKTQKKRLVEWMDTFTHSPALLTNIKAKYTIPVTTTYWFIPPTKPNLILCVINKRITFVMCPRTPYGKKLFKSLTSIEWYPNINLFKLPKPMTITYSINAKKYPLLHSSTFTTSQSG